MDFLKNKKILITGGTGSLGQALTKKLLQHDIDSIRILSRNENKQVMMAREIKDDRLRFFIGDVRDYSRLLRAFEDVDIVIHAAALKHVNIIEYNPFEAIKTNVQGAQNVIDACIERNVEIAIGVSTDKAVSPLNTYGATKMILEKLFISANNYINKNKHKTKFIAVRYGNVLGSSGSVVPMFIDQITHNQNVTITDPNMTRFSLTMDEALEFILDAVQYGKGSEIFVPKLKAYKITDVRDALFSLIRNTGEKNISIRPGEKMHETLINNDETRYTWEYQGMYVIFSPDMKEEEIKTKYEQIVPIKNFSSYSSDTVKNYTVEEIKNIISKLELIK
jgi:UDP-N-acetylglucosamine 4,6-dehydratase/5-epimerase